MKRLFFFIGILILLTDLAYAGCKEEVCINDNLSQRYITLEQKNIQLARGFTMMSGGGGSAAACTSAYTGDLFKEGFEGCAADGSTGCDAGTWGINNGTPVFNQTLSGTPNTRSCSKGLQVVSSGESSHQQAYYNYTTTIADNGKYWMRFSINVVSGLASQWNVTRIMGSGSNADLANMWMSIRLINTTGSNIVIYLHNGTTGSSGIELSAGWHQIDACIADGGETADACSTGTNGMSWLKVDGGSPVTLAGVDAGAQSYFVLGSWSPDAAVTIQYGYFAVDDDGTFE